MTIQICLAGIFFSQHRYLVVFCNQTFAVGIKRNQIFFMRITGITHCKMRAHLFCDQDRQFIPDIIFFRKYICKINSSRTLALAAHRTRYADYGALFIFLKCEIQICTNQFILLGCGEFQIFM